MRAIFSTCFILCLTTAFSQQTDFQRKGFIFGVSVGTATTRLTTAALPTQKQSSFSLPNIKVGTMLTPRTALILYLPGSIYSYKESGRVRDRGFEGIIPSLQYWVKDRWWLLGGAGLTLDAPAFYDIKDETERKFYFGPSVVLGTGYEVWRKGRFALDIQSRVHYGTANVPQGKKEGLAFNFLLGFSWY